MDGNVPILSIYTVPRSGTWWNLYFFYFYHHAVIGTTDIPLPMRYETLFDYRDSLGYHFQVQHSTCPGFLQRAWPHREQWEALDFSIPGYDGRHAAMTADPEYATSPPCLYIYRNPLDHFVSMFRHGQNHTSDSIRTFVMPDGRVVSLDTAFDFAMHHGIQCYIKQYLTFKSMGTICPDKVVMRPYEAVSRHPEEHFRSIFSLFRIPLREEAFKTALACSNKDSMSNLESRLGGAIGSDQKDSASRHIRDGSAGQWSQHFTHEQVAVIRDRFLAFGIDLDDFDLGQ